VIDVGAGTRLRMADVKRRGEDDAGDVDQTPCRAGWSVTTEAVGRKRW
jgi:hypothetical protein